jgi:hypothetical protein
MGFSDVPEPPPPPLAPPEPELPPDWKPPGWLNALQKMDTGGGTVEWIVFEGHIRRGVINVLWAPKGYAKSTLAGHSRLTEDGVWVKRMKRLKVEVPKLDKKGKPITDKDGEPEMVTMVYEMLWELRAQRWWCVERDEYCDPVRQDWHGKGFTPPPKDVTPDSKRLH